MVALVLAANVARNSRLKGRSEVGALAAHKGSQKKSVVAAHQGCAAKLIGDGALVGFESVADAVACPCLLEVWCRGSLRRYSQKAQVLFDCYKLVPIGVDRRERRSIHEFKR